MPLTDQQIESIFQFTKKKSVRYYDLQVELVDHLASSIEEEMTANIKLTFEQALQKVYNRFGIFGFSKVVQEREAAVLKNNRRIWKQAVKSFFTLPKFIVTICIFFAASLVAKLLTPDLLTTILFITWSIFTIVELRIVWLAKKRVCKKLLLTQFTNMSSISGFIFPYYHILFSLHTSTNTYVFAAVMVSLIVFESAIIAVNKQVRIKAMQLYPEAFVTVNC